MGSQINKKGESEVGRQGTDRKLMAGHNGSVVRKEGEVGARS